MKRWSPKARLGIVEMKSDIVEKITMKYPLDAFGASIKPGSIVVWGPKMGHGLRIGKVLDILFYGEKFNEKYPAASKLIVGPYEEKSAIRRPKVVALTTVCFGNLSRRFHFNMVMVSPEIPWLKEMIEKNELLPPWATKIGEALSSKWVNVSLV